MKGFGEMRIVVAIITTIAAAFLVLAVCLFIMILRASAHDALPTAKMPLGWSYPFSCCAGYDCKQVPYSEVIQTPNGYEIKQTHEIIPYKDTKIKDSPDGEFHWCAHQSGPNKDKTICLFVPPPSY